MRRSSWLKEKMVAGVGFVILMMAACQSHTANRNGLFADRDEPIVDECFSALLGGAIDASGKFAQLSMVEGPCQGNSKAIVGEVVASEVVVVSGTSSFRSSVYVQGQDVVVVDGTNRIKIGELDPLPENAELKLTNAKASANAQQGIIQIAL